jgi:hypothetical protein
MTKLTAKERAESQRFSDRLRFDQCKFWTSRAEERSAVPSSWPAFAAACRKWGIPVTFGRKMWSL